MKKYIYLLSIFLIGGGLFSYFYLYKEHRSVESEKACFNVSAKNLFNTYSANEKKAIFERRARQGLIRPY